MPTTQENRAFADEMNDQVSVEVSKLALDAAISWIQINLEPDEVFPEKDLKDWAESNGYVKE